MPAGSSCRAQPGLRIVLPLISNGNHWFLRHQIDQRRHAAVARPLADDVVMLAQMDDFHIGKCAAQHGFGVEIFRHRRAAMAMQ